MATADLNDLNVLVALAETRSFSAAARRLEVPKSTVSRSIARLEADLGIRLVHRTTRHVALSSAGTSLYERVVAPLAALRESVGALPEEEQQLSGTLRVTTSVDFGSSVLADVVEGFLARHPLVQVDAVLSNEYLDLVAEGMDLAIRFSSTRLKDSSLSARRIAPSVLQLFAAPAYLARKGTPRTPADLDAHEWVRFRASPSLRLDGPDTSVTVVPRGRILVNDMTFIRAAVLQGGGIGVLPTFIADADVAAGRLVRVLPRWSTESGHLWIVRPGAREAPRKVSVFVEFLLDSLRVRGVIPREA